MSSRRKKAAGKDETKQGSQPPLALADAAFVPPAHVSASSLVLQRMFEPRVTKHSKRATSTSSSLPDSPEEGPRKCRQAGGLGQTNYPQETTAPNPSNPSNPAGPRAKPSASLVPSQALSNSTTVVLPGPSTNSVANPPPGDKAPRKEKLISIDDRGGELWGYSDEESMVDASDNELLEDDMAGLQTVEEEDELDSMSDPYVELPTLSEPSIAVLAAPPVPARNVGGRKGKKKDIGGILKELDDDAEFRIKCWIKTGAAGTSADVDIPSIMSFMDFKAEIAGVLSVREAAVELCYHFTFGKDKALRQLTSEKNWSTLVSEAHQYRSKPTTKRAGNQDAWSVQLKEVGEVVEGRGGPSKKKTPVAISRGVTPPVASSASSSEPHDLEEKLKWVNMERGCNTHGGQYCLIPTDEWAPIFLKFNLPIQHLRLTDADRLLWARDICAGTSTRKWTRMPVIESICSRAAATRNIGAGLMQPPARQPLPPITPSRYQYTTSAQAIMQVAQQISQPVQRSSGIPRSTAIDIWLEGLDQDPSRRHVSIKYTSFIQSFADEDIGTVGELLLLGLDDLTKVGGIKVGTARRLLTWASEDV